MKGQAAPVKVTGEGAGLRQGGSETTKRPGSLQGAPWAVEGSAGEFAPVSLWGIMTMGHFRCCLCCLYRRIISVVNQKSKHPRQTADPHRALVHVWSCPLLLPCQNWLPRQWDFLLVSGLNSDMSFRVFPGTNSLRPRWGWHLDSALRQVYREEGEQEGPLVTEGSSWPSESKGTVTWWWQGRGQGEKLTHERPPLQRRSHAQCSPLHAQFSFISWLFLLGVLLLLLTYIHCAQYWFRIDSVLGTSNALTAFTPPTLSLESPLPYSPTSLFSLSFSLSSLPSAFITYMIQNICLYDFMYL